MDVILISNMTDVDFRTGPKSGLPYRYLGPYKVAHYLRKAGFTSQVIDFVVEYDEETLYSLMKKFVTTETSVIGISSTFISSTPYEHSDGKKRRIPEHLHNCINKIKAEYPKVKIAAGGHLMFWLHGFIDFTVEGEAEDTMVDILRYLKTGKNEPPYKVTTMLYDDKPGKVYTGPIIQRYKIELDDFKFSEQDCIVEGETLPLEISRGCIFKCKFCQYRHTGKNKFDFLRSMDLIKDEMLYNYEKFKVTNYNVICDTFNDSEFKMNQWHAAVTSLPFKINYNAYIRADLLHRFDDVVHILADTGLFGAYHGIETFHPEAARIIGKGWSGKEAKEYLPILFHDKWKGKIPMHTNFIVGLPKDTLLSMVNSVKWHADNNMHSIKFWPLGLVENSQITLSEFEKNASAYGFSFDGKNGSWVNGDWNYVKAINVAHQLNTSAKPFNHLHSWLTVNLMSMGVPKEDLFMNTTEFFKKYNSIGLKKKFVDKYLQKIINL